MHSSSAPTDHIRTMKSGSMLTTLGSWHATSAQDHIHLTSPEKDLSVYFFEAKDTEDLKKTALETWMHLFPEFDLEISQELSPPTTGHWEKAYQVIYKRPLSEAQYTMAIVRTYKGIAYVNLIDSKIAGISRRSAELAFMSESWKPLGIEENLLENREAKEWTQADKDEFEKFIHDAMQKLEIPGAAIAVINKKGEKIYSRAFGINSLDSRDQVTLDTPFMIGSISKPLTTFLMARLIDEGKFTWDTPISAILPDFNVGGTEFTKKLSMRHTVSASTGMPQGGFECFFKFVKPEDRLAEMKEMQPTTALGETFQYSNYMVMAGGFIAAHAAMPKMSLEDAYNLSMKKYVFDPLQMKNSLINPDEALKYKPALPHTRDFNGKVNQLPLHLERFAYSLAPAGAVWASANDLSQYMLMEMNNGVVNGQRIVSEEALLERRKPGIRITADTSYGLCLLTANEQGLQTVGHSGGTMGFSSDLFFIPKKGIGMLMLTNCFYAHPFIAAVKQKLMEITFSARPKAQQSIDNFYNEIQESTKKMQETVSVANVPNPWVEALVGEYVNDRLGIAKIIRTLDDKHYEMIFKEWKSEIGIQTEKNGEQIIVLVGPVSLKFQVNDSGLVFEAAQERYVFKKHNLANNNSYTNMLRETNSPYLVNDKDSKAEEITQELSPTNRMV